MVAVFAAKSISNSFPNIYSAGSTIELLPAAEFFDSFYKNPGQHRALLVVGIIVVIGLFALGAFLVMQIYKRYQRQSGSL